MVQHAPGYCSCQLLSFSQVSTCQLQSTINWSALSDSIVRPCNLCSATVCLTWLQHAISTEGIEMTYSTLPKVPGRGIFIWYDCCFSQLFLLLVPAPCFTHACHESEGGTYLQASCELHAWSEHTPGGSVNQYSVSAGSMSSENKASSYVESTLLSSGPNSG